MFIKLTKTELEDQYPQGRHTIPTTTLVKKVVRYNVNHIVSYEALTQSEINRINRPNGDRLVRSRVQFQNDSVFVCETVEQIDSLVEAS